MYALSLDIAYAQKLFPAFLHSTNRRGHSVTNIPHEATVSLRLARRFIDGLQEAAFPFEALLQDILRYQGKHNPPLSAYWKSKGFDSGEVRDFDEVPAVPTDVFRYVELCSNEAPPQGVFIGTKLDVPKDVGGHCRNLIKVPHFPAVEALGFPVCA